MLVFHATLEKRDATTNATQRITWQTEVGKLFAVVNNDDWNRFFLVDGQQPVDGSHWKLTYSPEPIHPWGGVALVLADAEVIPEEATPTPKPEVTDQSSEDTKESENQGTSEQVDDEATGEKTDQATDTDSEDDSKEEKATQNEGENTKATDLADDGTGEDTDPDNLDKQEDNKDDDDGMRKAEIGVSGTPGDSNYNVLKQLFENSLKPVQKQLTDLNRKVARNEKELARVKNHSSSDPKA
ncbi:hypothetical protein EFM26_06210 [Limosilactobacillus fermentum]|uniref:hypothetical protein n=1 Tax=Limosilactobacillus fermentum TaxID=1613 RepID=UPI0021A62167|nr:hypothetical protein [Limosilactobacillus fermentum]MCT2918150.1 hypothetical protein [Limosilactobacillus fermentum]